MASYVWLRPPNRLVAGLFEELAVHAKRIAREMLVAAHNAANQGGDATSGADEASLADAAAYWASLDPTHDKSIAASIKAQ